MTPLYATRAGSGHGRASGSEDVHPLCGLPEPGRLVCHTVADSCDKLFATGQPSVLALSRAAKSDFSGFDRFIS